MMNESPTAIISQSNKVSLVSKETDQSTENSPRGASSPLNDPALPMEVLESTAARRTRMSYELSHFLTSSMQPNVWTDCARQRVFLYVENQVKEVGRRLGIDEQAMRIHLFGSFFLSTYLPEGDIDITVQCPVVSVSSLMNMLYDRFLRLGVPVQFVQADVKLIKCQIEDICVDISFNQLMGLTTAFFVTDVNDAIPNNLFKRSLLLLKTWAFYESRTLGANGGMLGSYALTIMLVSVINDMHRTNQLLPNCTELDILLNFFDFYADHDVREHIITIYGPRAVSGRTSQDRLEPYEEKASLISTQFMKIFRARNRAFFQHLHVDDSLLPPDAKSDIDEDPPYELQKHRPMNIADPLRSNNNLARGVHLCHATRIQLSLERAAKRLRLLLDGAEAWSKSKSLAQPKALLVAHAGTPEYSPLSHSLTSQGLAGDSCFILSFFENAFRKCVLSKLIDDQRVQVHQYPVDDVDERAHLYSLVAHGGCSEFRETWAGRGATQPMAVYPEAAYIDYMHSLGELARVGAFGRAGSKKPKKQNQAQRAPSAHSSVNGSTLQLRHSSPRAPHSAHEQLLAKERTLKLKESKSPGKDNALTQDRRGFQAGDLIALTFSSPEEKNHFEKATRRRSSSCGALFVHCLPQKAQTGSGGTENPHNSKRSQQHNQQKNRNSRRPYFPENTDAFNPVQLLGQRRFPTVRSPFAYPLGMPGEEANRSRSPFAGALPVYAMPFAYTMGHPHHIRQAHHDILPPAFHFPANAYAQPHQWRHTPGTQQPRTHRKHTSAVFNVPEGTPKVSHHLGSSFKDGLTQDLPELAFEEREAHSNVIQHTDSNLDSPRLYIPPHLRK